MAMESREISVEQVTRRNNALLKNEYEKVVESNTFDGNFFLLYIQ